MVLSALSPCSIPSAGYITPNCAWCWQAEYPTLPFPESWSSTICGFHKGWLLASKRGHTNKIVDFILIDTPQPEPLYFPYVPHINYARYPSNWSKVSWIIRREAGFRCEWCGSSYRLRTHHMGVPYVTGKPGNKYDKHDIRRENLYALCERCERKADRLFPAPKPDKSVYASDQQYRECERERKRTQERIQKHRALGIGTGLVVSKGR